MSFVRPELAVSATRLFHRYFTHWIESVVVLVIGGFGIAALVAGISQRGIPAIIVGAASLVVAGLAAVAFHRTALARRDPTAVGVVEVHEGRVMYLAPCEDGGSADVRELTRVEIVTTASGPFEPDVFWVLTQPGQPLLTIPTEATGAGELFDALSALPGLSWEAVARAMSSTENARFLVWEKDPGDNRVVPSLRRLH